GGALPSAGTPPEENSEPIITTVPEPPDPEDLYQAAEGNDPDDPFDSGVTDLERKPSKSDLYPPLTPVKALVASAPTAEDVLQTQRLRAISHYGLQSSYMINHHERLFGPALVIVWNLLSAFCLPTLGEHLYWAHILDPPLFKPVSWWDPSPPVGNNDTAWIGGVWLPPSADQETESFNVNSSQFMTDLPPLCFTHHNNTGYVPVTQQLHLIAQEDKGVMTYTLIGIPGMRGRQDAINNTLIDSYTPDLPRCVLQKLSGGAQVTWHACRGIRPLSQNTSIGTIVDWGPHGVLWDKVENHSVPFGLHNHSLAWHGGGLAGPVLRFIEHNNSTASMLHNEAWRLGFAFLNRSLGRLYMSNITANYSNLQEDVVMICTSHPYIFALAEHATIELCNHSYCINMSNVWYKTCTSSSDHIHHNFSFIFLLLRRPELWLPVNLTREWEGNSGLGHFAHILQSEVDSARKRSRRFLGWLIFAIVLAIIILASATVAIASLAQSVQTAKMVKDVLLNATQELLTQEHIDEQILALLHALEAAVIWLGDRQTALKTRLSLHCDWEHTAGSLCVTPLPWNSSVHEWDLVKSHLQGAFDMSLQRNIVSLHDQLKSQISRLQELTTQSVFATLQAMSWLNPSTWFSGLNLRVWVFAGLAGLFLLFFFIIFYMICSLIRSSQQVEARIMATLLINGLLLNKKGGDVETHQ
uniref:Retroviral envelope protein GP41-like domain-containing protein n=1 Tax=Pelusios castaneus TaxID=367368 RepID=A0A8C8SC39_9SAUR